MFILFHFRPVEHHRLSETQIIRPLENGLILKMASDIKIIKIDSQHVI